MFELIILKELGKMTP